MAECPQFDAVLVLPHLRIQNANALSSPLTHGFPSMTAFIGLMWALERKARAGGVQLQFRAVGAVVHEHEEQATSDRYVKTLHLTRNPNDRSGNPSPIVEEGRIHLGLTLLLGVSGQALDDPSRRPQLAVQLLEMLQPLRVAGGSLIPAEQQGPRHRPYFMPIATDADARMDTFAATVPNWLPGFALVERTDLLQQRYEDLRRFASNSTQLDAWLSLSRINWSPDQPDSLGKAEWRSDRQGLGWVVPIPVGYGALTPLLPAGSVANSRDYETPVRLVESLYSIGEWISPHRLESVEQLLWYPSTDAHDGVYRCHNDYQPDTEPNFD
ncbi:type I-F CRISPR-associated protein Csy2 [Pseudomonas parafulva]|uniref:type I-F CRISPR-associated protein Csy2 n=1 Tax=Pseudomonas parafulva TaxID=157782 RepID=UPI000540D3F3|nr:type I-F CRISPR-associated protein Csy2 [Pseudomonas parafulva]AIZ31670.1 hypothetical protein NJ69_00945 [Pseudomonas parafulva]